MPASSGGSVVDPSLLRQANDRGVTIAFADLDGADGLWVPEERTILVSRKLTEADVARVIEHELTHVMIDDQHADLDAGKDVLVGHPPARGRRWVAAALTAAGLLAVVGGATYGLAKATGGPPKEQVAPPPPGLTASESAGMVVIPSRGPDGRIVYVKVAPGSRRAGTGTATPTPAPTATPSPTPTGTAVLPPKPSATKVPPATVSPTPPPVVVTTTPPAPPTTVPPTTPPPPPPTTDPPVGASDAPVGGQGDAGSDDTADGPGSAGASDVVVAGSGGPDPGVDPDG
ncbi:MAG TPA: hypothetical protein VI357_04635 [Mycobacteriales bacterium]